MDAGNFLRITCDFTVASASNPVVMVWDYRVASASGIFSLAVEGQNILDAFLARYYAPMANVVSNQVVMTHVAMRGFLATPDGYDKSGSLWTGGGGGNMMPPAITTAIQLTRSNYLMRNGRKAFPGAMAQSLNPDGTMATLIVNFIKGVTDVWISDGFNIEGDFSDIVLQEVIVRKPVIADTEPTVWSPIPSFGLAYFGTQNSRKK